MGDRSNIARIGILDVFGSCDLDLNLITFIYERDPYCLELYRMCKYELPTSRLDELTQCLIHVLRMA